MKSKEIKKYSEIIEILGKELRDLSDAIVSKSGAISHTKKLHAYDLLTELDVTVEDRITATLRNLDPDTPVVGEERGGDRTNSRHWLIDPIDGTIHFVRGNPFYCFMVALIENHEPIVSLIYNYETGELFHAIKGHGAYRNGAVLKVSERPPQEAIVVTEINLKQNHNVVLQQLLTIKYRLLCVFSPGYEFSMIAAGKAEARMCIDPFGKDYDFAPGSLLVREAGGVAKNLHGEDYRTIDTDLIVASSEEIYQALLQEVNASRNAIETVV